MEIIGVFWMFLVSLTTGDRSYHTTTADAAEGEIKRTEHCQLDSYRVGCADGQVVLVAVALYGRMRVGRCVKRDWGYIGCKTDVLAHVDRVCSGRRGCEFPVAELDGVQDCPRDLAPYLETVYQCVPVVVAESERCDVSEPITVTTASGYLASVVTMDTGRGGQDCPWRIEVQQGQKVNLTLLNFARIGRPSEWGASGAVDAPRPKVCYQLARIRERQYSRTLTECEGATTPRDSHAYSSTSNVVEVDMIVAKIHKVHFLIRFEAMGCASPPLQPGMSLRREGDNAIVKCNSTRVSWPLRCIGSTWEGQVENCTQSTASASSIERWNVFVNDAFPYSILIVVSVGVALGVFVGGVLLVCSARYFKRRHEGMTSDDDDYCQRPYEATEAAAKGTLVMSCDVLSSPTTANDDDDDHDPAAHPLRHTDLAAHLHHQQQQQQQQQQQARLRPMVPGSSSFGDPQRVLVECQCPYSVYDRFPCSSPPHGGCLTTPSPGTPTPFSADSSTTTTTTCAGSDSGSGAGAGRGGDLVSSQRIQQQQQQQQQQRGSRVFSCGPQPELLECLS